MSCPDVGIYNQNLIFTVRGFSGAGAATDADAAPTYQVFEDDTSTPIMTGTMTKLSDSVTGLYSESIRINSTNGFQRFHCYSVYITFAVGGNTTATNYNFLCIGS